MRWHLWLCWAFFVVNLFVVTYTISLEALVIPDVAAFRANPRYPLWPPKFLIDSLHTTWAQNFDRLIIARPAFYKTFMWWEMLFFGPYYAVAIFAFWKRRDWIRIPTIVFASVMLTKMSVLIAEGTSGEHASPIPAVYALAHTPHVLIPLWLLFWFWTHPHPFAPATAKPKAA